MVRLVVGAQFSGRIVEERKGEESRDEDKGERLDGME